ncbi:MAG: cupin domain-containing protein [Gammaproteobacteria bacterium]|nr:MAG: cupin domain-containing protein [Gammaproteobacteria bacterium]
MRTRIGLPIMMCLALAGHAHPGLDVVPEEERERARELQAKGPRETTGVEAIHALGAIPLAGEFDAAPDGHVLRARELVIAPGGVVGVHAHTGRPGVAYILEGALLEYRNDEDEPVLRRAGDASFEYSGLLHWWHNSGETAARALVVDIVPKDAASP